MHVNCTQLDWQVRLGQDWIGPGFRFGFGQVLARHPILLSVRETVLDSVSDKPNPVPRHLESLSSSEKLLVSRLGFRLSQRPSDCLPSVVA